MSDLAILLDRNVSLKSQVVVFLEEVHEQCIAYLSLRDNLEITLKSLLPHLEAFYTSTESSLVIYSVQQAEKSFNDLFLMREPLEFMTTKLTGYVTKIKASLYAMSSLPENVREDNFISFSSTSHHALTDVLSTLDSALLYILTDLYTIKEELKLYTYKLSDNERMNIRPQFNAFVQRGKEKEVVQDFITMARVHLEE